VPTEMLTREEREVQPLAIAPTPVEAKPYRSWRDLAGTAVAVLVVLVYAANVQDWWYLGSNRWAAVTMVAIGAIGCSLGARLVGENLTSRPIVLLGLLGAAALTLAILAIVTATQWALLALAVLVVALWAGTTLRHAAIPPPRLVTY
jgi:hypothetical protein